MNIAKYIYTLLLINLVVTFSVAQEIEWSKNYGGSNDDGAAYAVQTPDNGYIVVGGSLSKDVDVSVNKGSEDLWIFKIDAQGEIIWERSYGGSNVDRAYRIIPTMDGNYLIAGNTSSANGDVSNLYGIIDFWILKIDEDGEILWERNYGGSQIDGIRSIIELENGQILAIGSTQSVDFDLASNNGSVDIALVKLEENGDLIWARNYGGSGIDRANDVFELNENTYAFVAYVLSSDGDVTENHGKTDVWIVRVSAEGDILSEWSVGGSEDDIIVSTIRTADKGFLCGGRSYSIDGDVMSGKVGAWLLKLDKNLQIEWENSYGDVFMDYSMGLVSKDDNTYEISTIARKEGFDDYGFMNIDQFGKLINADYFGGTESDIMINMIPSSDGGSLLFGHSRSDDGDVGLNYGKADYWLIKMKGSIVNSNLEEEMIDLEVYPNPSSGIFEIYLGNSNIHVDRISVYNVLGQMIYHAPFTNHLDLTTLASGQYILKLYSDKLFWNQTIQIVK